MWLFSIKKTVSKIKPYLSENLIFENLFKKLLPAEKM